MVGDGLDCGVVVDWLVEFEGRRRRLLEVRSADFQAAIAPLKSHIESALASLQDDPILAGLKIVFSVDPSTGIVFTLEGPAIAVNSAIDRIGTEAEMSPAIRPS